MGKFLLITIKDFCARSVVTCDSYLRCDEIMVPASVVHRLTRPVVVHSFNIDALTLAMHKGNILFIQRTGSMSRLRSIAHIAILDLAIDPQTDRLLRHGSGRLFFFILTHLFELGLYS